MRCVLYGLRVVQGFTEWQLCQW